MNTNGNSLGDGVKHMVEVLCQPLEKSSKYWVRLGQYFEVLYEAAHSCYAVREMMVKDHHMICRLASFLLGDATPLESLREQYVPMGNQ